MNPQHEELARGRWNKMSFCEQMSNIGSEIQRAINWKRKNNMEYSKKASFRALELLDLSLDSVKNFPKIKEVARLRESVVDYFFGANIFASSDALFEKYFLGYTYLTRRHT